MEEQLQNDSCVDGCFCYLSKCCQMPHTSKHASPPPFISKRPYFYDLPTPLKIGHLVSIKGSMRKNCLKFHINLRCGKTEHADIAFHYNPRINERYLVRNCKIHGAWGDEETTSLLKFNANEYKKFEIHICASEEGYLVSLNGKHQCSFAYRVPLDSVHRLEIQGPVNIEHVDIRTISYYPNPIVDDYLYCVPVAQGSFDVDSSNTIRTPLTAILPKTLQEGWQIYIYGKVNLLPHSFYINLQVGYQIWPHPVIPLHVNPRFCTAVGENLIVRNAWNAGQWGPEERTPNFNFSPGAPFTVVIRKFSDHFALWVDDSLIGEFKFRFSADNIDTIYIQGDVVIYQIVLEKRETETSFQPQKRIHFT